MSTPKRFGRYEVIRPLGQGGMGAVYLARDESLGREVAVKTLHPFALAGAFAGLMRDRFTNEARAVASLAHPNIVQIFDLGVEGDVPFLVMEVVRGRSLGEKIQAGRLSLDDVRQVGGQIAQALAAAHTASILHRDVKPSNILEATPGVWKLTDFGVAKMPESKLTLTGQFLGTLNYAAPEGVVGGQFSPASDVYSLGRTLYEALTGGHPFGAPEAGVVASAKNLPPRPISAVRPDVPADVERAILETLAHDPAKRPSAAALATALAQASSALASTPPVADTAITAPTVASATAIVSPSRQSEVGRPRRRWLWITAAVGATALVALAIGLGTRHSDEPSAPVRPAAEVTETRLAAIEKKVQAGALDEAIRDLEQLVKEDPGNERAGEWLARLHLAVGGQVIPAP